jgi:hypothetical protein
MRVLEFIRRHPHPIAPMISALHNGLLGITSALLLLHFLRERLEFIRECESFLFIAPKGLLLSSWMMLEFNVGWACGFYRLITVSRCFLHLPLVNYL